MATKYGKNRFWVFSLLNWIVNNFWNTINRDMLVDNFFAVFIVNSLEPVCFLEISAIFLYRRYFPFRWGGTELLRLIFGFFHLCCRFAVVLATQIILCLIYFKWWKLSPILPLSAIISCYVFLAIMRIIGDLKNTLGRCE